MRESNPDGQVLSQSIMDTKKMVICQYSAAAVATVRYGFKETRLQRKARQVFWNFRSTPMYLYPLDPVVPFVRNARISTGK